MLRACFSSIAADRAWIDSSTKRAFASKSSFGIWTLVRNEERPAGAIVTEVPEGFLIKALDGDVHAQLDAHETAVLALHHAPLADPKVELRSQPSELALTPFPMALPKHHVDPDETLPLLPGLALPALPFSRSDVARPPVRAADEPRKPDTKSPPSVQTAPLPPMVLDVQQEASHPRGRETAWLPPDEPSPASLPFAKDAAPLPVRSPGRVRENAGESKSSPFHRKTALASGFEAAPPLPFKESSVDAHDLDLSMFPLERYAEVSVALATGDDRGRVLRRFVLTEAMWKALSAAWGARVMADTKLQAAFKEVVQRLRSQSPGTGK